MLKLLGFLGALLVGVLIVWLVAVALSPSYNSCVQNNGQHSTEHYNSNGEEIIEGPVKNPTRWRLLVVCGGAFANRNGEAFTGLFTIALTIATFLLGFLAWGQGQTTRAELRAYVYPDKAILTHFGFTTPIRISVVFCNGGVTPARDLQIHGSTFIAIFPTPDWSDFPEPGENPETGQHSKSAMWPKQEPSSVDFPAEEMLLPQVQAEMLKGNPGAAIYVAGAAHYRDVFGRKRRTNFCRYVHPDDAKRLITNQQGHDLLPEGWQPKFLSTQCLNDFT